MLRLLVQRPENVFVAKGIFNGKRARIMTEYICPNEAVPLLKKLQKQLRAGDNVLDKAESDQDPSPTQEEEWTKGLGDIQAKEDDVHGRLRAMCRGDGTAIYRATFPDDKKAKIWVDDKTGKATSVSPLCRKDDEAKKKKGHVIHEYCTGRTWAIAFSVHDTLVSISNAIRKQLSESMPARGVYDGKRLLYTSAKDLVLRWEVSMCGTVVEQGADFFRRADGADPNVTLAA
jgi:hypothetical protein